MSYNVDKIAKLAHIDLTEAKRQQLSHQFGAILDYVTVLSDLELESITKSRDYSQTLREDIANQHSVRFSNNVREQILQQMPQVENGYLVVKSVLKNP